MCRLQRNRGTRLRADTDALEVSGVSGWPRGSPDGHQACCAPNTPPGFPAEFALKLALARVAVPANRVELRLQRKRIQCVKRQRNKQRDASFEFGEGLTEGL